ncbi:MAG TPA: formylglycine-generating enzyme family protein, partial [Anaerolineales bacterium]|nr:formylglycine-generating enzyme family protein [Anaerolineales bacterium]
AGKCNSSESGIGRTTPVGKYSPHGDSPYGVADMAGNVWEWCRSKFKQYPYDASDGRENLGGDDALRIVRGGSWYNNRWHCRAACRNGSDPAYFHFNIGFRAALSPLSS